MRLTLRTLLAYLDDTLEPSDIKQIGQKVAESDAAQELIERIKQVTRRRRLTTPPDTGDRQPFDPNTVAAYLDNELPSEQVAELEKLCLESDVHLAEVAACHQILTLVLGEPALVPPTAKERMYGLVKGREAIPFRKAPADGGGEGDDEEDDAMISVLAFHRRQNSWKRWALPVAGVILFLALPVVLIAALLQGSNAPRETHASVANSDKTPTDKDSAKDSTPAKDTGTPKDKDKAGTDGNDPNKDKSNTDGSNKDGNPKDQSPKDNDPKKDKTNTDGGPVADKGPERPAAPSTERIVLAKYKVPEKMDALSMLVQRANESGSSWKRVSPNSPVYTSDKLVSLPGYASEIATNSGVRLQLSGTHPRFYPAPMPQVIFESAVTLHANPKFDLDLTLDRGRIFLANAKDKDAARVRVRFEKEVWDLTLSEPGSEVAMLFFKVSPPNLDWHHDEPPAHVRFCVVQGKAGLKVDYQDYPSLEFPGPAYFSWDSYGTGIDGPKRVTQPLAAFSKEMPASKEVNDLREALVALSMRLVGNKAVNVVLREVIDDGPPLQRSHCIDCLGAIDAIPALLDVLDNTDEARASDRLEAVLVLCRWVGRGSAYARQLYDAATKSGFLIDKKYTPGEAAIVLKLLHYFDELEVKERETYEFLAGNLTSNKVAIRELANWHLVNLARGVKSIPQFNAAWDQDKRNRAAAEWMKMIDNKELPPPAVTAPPQPTGTPPGPK
jgi:hypothetical protein